MYEDLVGTHHLVSIFDSIYYSRSDCEKWDLVISSKSEGREAVTKEDSSSTKSNTNTSTEHTGVSKTKIDTICQASWYLTDVYGTNDWNVDIGFKTDCSCGWVECNNKLNNDKSYLHS